MMSQTSSRSRIIATWLVLLALLCMAMAPSMALAKKEMTIATEGDPDDGLDYSGGGSGFLDFNDSSNLSNSDLKLNGFGIYVSLTSQEYAIRWTVYFDAHLGVFVIIPSTEVILWRANQ
jgi:hypothetical protein